MNFTFTHALSVQDYLRLRQSVGWKAVSARQAENNLRNSAYLVVVRDGENTTAAARLVSDGGTVQYIADVMVLPEFQGRGLGKIMVGMILDHVRGTLEPGEWVRVNLMAASGKEPFYRKMGFSEHPCDQNRGAGMSITLEK